MGKLKLKTKSKIKFINQQKEIKESEIHNTPTTIHLQFFNS